MRRRTLTIGVVAGRLSTGGSGVGKRAYTLVELLAVFVIVATLAALAYPAIGLVKQEGKEAHAMSNLKQVWVAIALYREQHDVNGALLGFPSEEGFYFHGVLSSSAGPALRSPCGHHPEAPGGQANNLTYFAGDDSWTALIRKTGDEAVLVADWNCNPPTAFLYADFTSKKVLFARINGTLVRKSIRGRLNNLELYH